jgi:uncharacterized DUF497 family protein
MTLGLSGTGGLVVMVHTIKTITKEQMLIRVISCRKADRREIRVYQGLSHEERLRFLERRAG